MLPTLFEEEIGAGAALGRLGGCAPPAVADNRSAPRAPGAQAAIGQGHFQCLTRKRAQPKFWVDWTMSIPQKCFSLPSIRFLAFLSRVALQSVQRFAEGALVRERGPPPAAWRELSRPAKRPLKLSAVLHAVGGCVRRLPCGGMGGLSARRSLSAPELDDRVENLHVVHAGRGRVHV